MPDRVEGRIEGGIDSGGRGPSGLPAGYPYRPEWERTPGELAEAIRSGRPPLIVDCRTEPERAIATIAGSMHVPLAELERRIDDVREAAEGSEGSSPRSIVVHCHHGVRSLRATAILRAAGLVDSHSLAGGIDQWSVAVDRSIPRY
jgi:adenylyltransferase/sulfurtransferase